MLAAVLTCLHDVLGRKALVKRASKQPAPSTRFSVLAEEREIVRQLLAARTKAGLTQEAVAERMGTTKSAISRLESAGSRHAPSLSTLQKYAEVVGCKVQVRLVSGQ